VARFLWRYRHVYNRNRRHEGRHPRRDIFDMQSQKLIWCGNEMAGLSRQADRNAKNLAKNIGSMFKHFPLSM
jgi:hypothetical protein